MELYALGFLIGCVFLSSIDVVEAIQCYRCMYTNTTETLVSVTDGDPNCQDPFDATGIEIVECSSQCYTQGSFTSSISLPREQFSRGCAAETGRDCKVFGSCFAVPGTVTCTYNNCCEYDNCNSRDVRDLDENVFKCYNCYGELDGNGMPVDNNTCGLADFDGTDDPFNVIEIPCESGTCLTQFIIDDAGGSILRSCAVDDASNLCVNETTYEAFGGVAIDCCTEPLCNVGIPSLEPPAVTSEPRPIIDCFNCATDLTADGLPVDQSSCGRADFDGSGQDVVLERCEIGVCLTLYLPASDPSSTSGMIRSCIPAQYIVACDNPSLSEPLFGSSYRLECCYESECNTANLVTTDSDTMTTAGVDGIAKIATGSALVLIFSTIFTYEAVV